MEVGSSSVEALRRRDDAAWNAVVSRYQRAVTAAIARRLGGRDNGALAADLSVEVFVTAWRLIGEFPGETEEDLLEWLLRLADEAAIPR
jgi:DNA-directed RNA polymerase specialized sigma24 family protein